MKPTYRHLMAGLASSAVLLISACGGGGGGDSAPTPPTAVAKPSQSSAPIGTTITLDGSGSTTPNGGSLSYAWTLSGKPDGSASTLSDATLAKPAFTPDKPGDYVVDLVVKDGKAGSTAVRLTIKVTNPDPVALVATPAQSVLQGTVVSLDGSGSLPPTGTAASDLRYEWKLIEQPAGTLNTRLTDAGSAKASFTAGKLGVYRATLIVRHGDRVSTAAQAEVSVNNGNSRPVAKISVPKAVVRGSTVLLDGSGSSDADGDALHYRWSFAPFVPNSSNPPKPRASTATIRNAGSAKAEFVPDAVGKYYIDLTVYDNSVSSTERVILEVSKPAGAANAVPVAMIGNGSATEECEVGGYCGQSAYLSHDADGDALSFKWTYWNTATPNDKRSEQGAGLYALSDLVSAGTWQVQLQVNDGQADSALAVQTVVLKTGANVYPYGRAKVDAGTVLVGESLRFDASGSSDSNGDALSYEWTLIDRPDGSNAVLQSPTGVRSSVLTDKPGLYRVQLKVVDSKGAFRPHVFVQGFAKVRNNAPVVANFGLWGNEAPPADQPLVMRAVTENGSASNGVETGITATIFDPDLDTPLYYILTATKYPAGSTFGKSAAGQAASGSELSIGDPNRYRSFFFDRAGDYEFQLVASDGLAYSETRRLNFSVVAPENYPGILLESGESQLLWPVERDSQFLAGFDSDPSPTPREHGVYRLYAADRDYTVADLVAGSADASIKPYFHGLQSGQLIRKGESVTFKLMRPAIPSEGAMIKKAYQMEEGAAREAEIKRLKELFRSYQFSWSFRIAEKPGRSFYLGPAR